MDDRPEARRVLCRYRYDALDRIAVVDPEAQEAENDAAHSRDPHRIELSLTESLHLYARVFRVPDHPLTSAAAPTAAPAWPPAVA
ncbi:hypothetical protein ALQ59_103012 [Pseudomonas syringae pv. apii]|uniref:YD repeat-containing protein n=1 Tax=Pseudomonas syringae pv. apii TaxID=81036 RepID=A0A3M3RI60_9PSED|nr:hypothetical protein ALQ59_103012 [Pseudomonas syringae pv. apii]RMN58036.1 hypothetical protein ALQ58_102628 [Pseudomonas syringae pv. apii]RMN96097.1 hypothetical protein ALQ49_102206 [Pseudomonas syringae pv. apii]